MRWLDRARAAGRSRRTGDAREVEMHQQRLTIRAGDRDVRDVRSTLPLPAVDHRVRDDRQQPALQFVAQLTQPRAQRPLLLGGKPGGHAESDDARDVLGPRANAELLPAAMDDRLDRLAVTHDQRTDALGSADLVAGDGQERAIDVAERDWNLAERLDGVGMEQDAGVATSTGERPDGLQRADFVVHPHHAHDGDAVREDLLERLRLNLAGRRNWENDLLTTEVFDGVRGGERRLVLRRGDGDTEWVAAIPRRQRGTDDGEVVRFRAARGEHDLVRLAPHGRGDGALRLFDSGARGAAEAVRRGGIPERLPPEVGQHGL